MVWIKLKIFLRVYTMVKSMGQNWENGVAFVRGVNMYGNARITHKEMLDLCKQIEEYNLQILKIYKTDNIFCNYSRFRKQ